MIEVQAGTLAKAMKAIDAIVERRNTIPVLANVLLEASKDGIRLCGTDLDLWIETHVERTGKAKDVKPFAVTVEAHALRQIAGALPAESSCTLSCESNLNLTVRGVAGEGSEPRWSLPTLPVDDFPGFIGDDWDQEFVIETLALEAAIDAVRFAISTEETRYYLNGIYIHTPDLLAPGSDQPALVFGATDGHRLARHASACPDGADGVDGIIPRKACLAIDGLCAGDEGAAEIKFWQNRRFRVEIGGTTLCGKLIDGTFPDYTRVIPTGNNLRVLFEPERLAAAVKRVQLLGSAKTNLIRMDLIDGAVRFSLTSPEHGQAEETVPCREVDGELTIGFNAAYLLDILKAIPGAFGEVLLGTPDAPSLWRAGEDASRTYVLMPMRVGA